MEQKNKNDKIPLLRGYFMKNDEKNITFLIRFNEEQDINGLCVADEEVMIGYIEDVKIEKVVLKYSEEENKMISFSQTPAKIDDCKEGTVVLMQLSTEDWSKESIENREAKIESLVYFEDGDL